MRDSTSRDGRGGIASAARFLALSVDDGTMRGGVLLDEVNLAAELACHGADLHLDLAKHLIALAADHRSARHQGNDLLEIG